MKGRFGTQPGGEHSRERYVSATHVTDAPLAAVSMSSPRPYDLWVAAAASSSVTSSNELMSCTSRDSSAVSRGTGCNSRCVTGALATVRAANPFSNSFASSSRRRRISVSMVVPAQIRVMSQIKPGYLSERLVLHRLLDGAHFRITVSGKVITCAAIESEGDERAEAVAVQVFAVRKMPVGQQSEFGEGCGPKNCLRSFPRYDDIMKPAAPRLHFGRAKPASSCADRIRVDETVENAFPQSGPISLKFSCADIAEVVAEPDRHPRCAARPDRVSAVNLLIVYPPASFVLGQSDRKQPARHSAPE